MRNQLLFHQIQIRQSQLVAAAKSLEGIAYGENNEIFLSSGQWRGKLNCFGFPCHVAKMVGLLDEDADINFSPAVFGQEKTVSIRLLLHLNFTCIFNEKRRQIMDLQPGDVLLEKWRDVSPTAPREHHVSMCLSPIIGRHQGEKMHANSRKGGGTGKVARAPLTLLDEMRIVRAYRLKGVIAD
jgi:hypothetical protein